LSFHALRERRSFSKLQEVLPPPNLIEVQKGSFEWFLNEGLAETLADISPIEDFTGNLALLFDTHRFEPPKFDQDECKDKDLDYSRTLFVTAVFHNKETEEVKHQTVFMGDFPWMTDQGTFIINGAERVVVSQLVRSPGVYYTGSEDPSTGRLLLAAKVIPKRGYFT
jgi:DNA-directed RNA polymerase subunit beta